MIKKRVGLGYAKKAARCFGELAAKAGANGIESFENATNETVDSKVFYDNKTSESIDDDTVK